MEETELLSQILEAINGLRWQIVIVMGAFCIQIGLAFADNRRK